MKYAFLIAGMLLFSIASSQEVETLPRLQEAIVYVNSAKLIYEGKTDLPAGNVKIVFKGLSPYLIRESMTLKGVGDLEIINLRYENNYLVNERDNLKIRTLENQLRELMRKNVALEAEINALKDELQILKENAKLDKATLNAVQQYVAYYKKRLKAVHRQLFELQEKQKPLLKEIEKLKRQLNELKGKSKRKTKDLIAHVFSNRPQTLHYRLEYVTKNAGWKPSYRLKARKDKNKVDWTYQAEVSQHTGIDWENVKLRLSNFRPRYGLRLPEPAPWYLRPDKRPVYRAKGVITLEAAEADEAVLEYAETSISESDIDVEYALPQTYEVLSGGDPVLVTLQQFSTPSTFGYYAVPYLSPDAYILAEISDWGNYRLLPGKARLYYADRYTGETFIDPFRTQDTLKLSFGIDPEIGLERKTLKNFRDYKPVSGKVVVRREYAIEIINRKKIPVRLTVKDRVPVSEDEKIEVRNIRIDNGGKKDKNGIITWELHLKPGEKRTLKFGFEVKFPKNYPVYL